MTKKNRSHVDDLRGASRLAIDATKGVTTVVEKMHRRIASGPAVLGRPLQVPASLLTGLVYGGIRGVTSLVGTSIDLALEQLAPLLGESAPGRERSAIQAALNGVLGDHLVETHNPLAIEMCLRQDGTELNLDDAEALRAALPAANGRVLLMVHGSCMDDRLWLRRGHDHGAALARDLGVTPIYLLYNSGLHVSTNGEAFAALLERLHTAWPVPIEAIFIVAHSMGGLVTRSACHAAECKQLAWRQKLRAIVFLGTPHHGAPLERGGNWLEFMLGASSYSAPLQRLGRIRSAGVTDLRYGNVLEAHWSGRDRFEKGGDPRSPLPLPGEVACYAVAGKSANGAVSSQGGDGMVPVDSALGRHEDASMTLDFPETNRCTVEGAAHLDLLDREDVYQVVRRWLAHDATSG